MKNKRYMLFILTLTSSVSAETVSQTSWSGGPCETEIYANWDDCFLSCTSCDWFSLSGYLYPGAIRSDSCYMISDSQGFIDLCPIDFDFDGDMDILCINQIDQSVHWFENTSGNSWINHEIEVFDYLFEDLSSITCADLDANGEMDIVLGTYSGYISILYQLGSIFYPDAVQTSRQVYCIRSFDGSSDGDMDLMLIWELSWYGELCYMENDGTGYSWEMSGIDTIQRDFVFADVNSDGYIDVITARYWGYGLKWYTGCEISSTTGAWAVAGGDFDCDGDIDAAGDWCSGGKWFENVTGDGMEWAEKGFNNYPPSAYHPELASGDFDHDGDTDLARWSYAFVSMVWNEDYRGEDWSVQYLTPASSGSGDVYAVDVNSDGIDDVLACWSDGNIAWWQTAEKANCGVLTSSVVELSSDPHWESISWDSSEPEGSSISFLVRASDNPLDLGEWSDTISVSGSSLHGVLPDYANYLQYRVILEAENTESYPELQEVRIDYADMGTGSDPKRSAMVGITSNPSFGSAWISVDLQEGSSVTVEILDITGRTVAAPVSGFFNSGTHAFFLGDLPSGSYIYRCLAGSEEFAGRFIVIADE